MSTSSDQAPDGRAVAMATASFVKTFDAWMRHAAVDTAGESVPRLNLLYELHCNGPRKMADLADALGVTPRNVTALVDALEADALVQRAPHPTDRRVTMVELTGGAASVEERFGSFQRTLRELFDELPEADRRALARVLPRLQARIAALESDR